MRHRKKKGLLNRFTSWHKNTLISLVKNLLLHQQIITTRAKAKAASPLAEKLISLAKEDSLFCRRKAYKILGDHKLVSSLFKEIAPLFKGRTSGFTRIIPWKSRRGDSASLVVFELTEKKERPKKVKKEKTQEKPKPKEQITEEKPPIVKKPTKRFLGGLKGIFKKERDAL
ncbi:MAG: 50S ribosomal protein L17 [Candidatus Omnitrophica bacterium]|nr:50S ribosomal protein L17 [Candidatus Omnitrophota bacterium]